MKLGAFVAAGAMVALLGCPSSEEGTPVAGSGDSDPTGSTSTSASSATVDVTTVTTQSTQTSDAGTQTGPTTSSSTTDGTTAATTTDGSSTTAAPTTGEASTGVVDECDNGLHDGDETDVDCGGPQCRGCAYGSSCEGDGDCATGTCSGTTCSVAAPLIWLDGLDASTMYTNNGCTTGNPTDGDDVYCWRSKGTNNGTFEDSLNLGVYAAGQGLEFTDDGYALSGVFTGNLGDVAVFVVQTETNDRSALDFNLNHPNAGETRYSARIPSDTDRRLVFEVGGTAGLVQTSASIIEVGEQHLFGFVNSADLDQRFIFLDGAEQAQAAGAIAAAASNVSIGNGTDAILHEFRIYRPAPPPAGRRVIEGLLACRWDLRDQLPGDHPYYDADGAATGGCP